MMSIKMMSIPKTIDMDMNRVNLLNLLNDKNLHAHAKDGDIRHRSNERNLPGALRKAAGAENIAPTIHARADSTQISVVVPTYNRPQLLDRCLGALAAQVYDVTRFEIIVVDDGPHQATREVADKWSSRRKTTGPRILYVPSDGPHGPAAARNRGWQCASGAVIAFTDDDTIPYPDWLANGLAVFDGTVQAAWGRIVMPLEGMPTDYERDARNLETAEFVTANCFCLKQVLEELGGFDERFRLAWREDADLYFRLLQADIAIAHVPQAVVEHPIRPARWGVSLSQQKKVQFDALLFKKHRRLYRQRIRASARWDYYAIILCLLAMLAAPLMGHPWAGLAAGLCWAALTGRFCLQRLRGTVLSASHVTEMIVTSMLIPPLAVFWRVVGAIRFRVGFA